MMRFLLLGLFMGWSSSVFAQDEAPKDAAETEVLEAPVPEQINGRIVDVRIDGLRQVEEAALMAAVGIRAGDLIASWKVRRDLVAIYETGFVMMFGWMFHPLSDSTPTTSIQPLW